MAYEINVGEDVTFPTITDLTGGNQFLFCVLGSNGNITIAGAGALATGITQDNPKGATGAPVAVSVRCGGVSKIFCGGTFVAGDKISSDASGRAVKYTGATVFTGTPYTVSGTQVLGIALEAGLSGQESTILFNPSGLSA